MLYLGRSPTRPAPSPRTESRSISPTEPSPGIGHAASPDERRSPSYIEKFLMASDEEADAQYFANFRVGTSASAVRSPSGDPHAASSWLHDTSTDEDTEVQDDSNPHPRLFSKETMITAEYEDVDSEVEAIEAKIAEMRQAAWRDVFDESPLVSRHNRWAAGSTRLQPQRREPESPDFKPPPPMDAIPRRPPLRAAPFRLPSYPPNPIPRPTSEEEARFVRVDPYSSDGDGDDTATVEVSSVSSSSSSSTRPTSSVTTEDASNRSSLMSLPSSHVGTMPPGTFQCSPPPGEQVERVLSFAKHHDEEASPSLGIRIPTHGRRPQHSPDASRALMTSTEKPRHFQEREEPSPTPFVSLSPYIRTPDRASPESEEAQFQTVEVELAPGEVVSVIIREGDTAVTLAERFIRDHCLDATNAAVRDVLLGFFSQYTPAAQKGHLQEHQQPAVQTRKSDTHAAASSPDGRGGVQVRYNPTVADRARSVGVPMLPSDRHRSVSADKGTTRLRAQSNPLPDGPVRQTKASRLLAQANAARRAKALEEKKKEVVAAFVDPYMIPSAIASGHRGEFPVGKTHTAGRRTCGRVDPQRGTGNARVAPKSKAVLSSEERELMEHCTFTPRVNHTSERLFVVLQQKGLPAPQLHCSSPSAPSVSSVSPRTTERGLETVHPSAMAGTTSVRPSPRLPSSREHSVSRTTTELLPSPPPRRTLEASQIAPSAASRPTISLTRGSSQRSVGQTGLHRSMSASPPSEGNHRDVVRVGLSPFLGR